MRNLWACPEQCIADISSTISGEKGEEEEKEDEDEEEEEEENCANEEVD